LAVEKGAAVAANRGGLFAHVQPGKSVATAAGPLPRVAVCAIWKKTIVLICRKEWASRPGGEKANRFHCLRSMESPQ
jgi:hypothetical protein